MADSLFYEKSDEIFYRIEEWLEASGLDIDIVTGGGMLTIVSEQNGSQIVISRQSAVSEIWVAARSGGFHFAESEGVWLCKTGESLQQLLNRVLLEQLGEAPAEKLDLSL